MNTKLIIVEGLPGSGKSTTAQIVYDILKDKGVKVELFSEGNYNHPADYDGTAYFKDEEFRVLEESFIERKDILDKIKIKYFNGYLIPFIKAVKEQKLLTFDDDLFQSIAKNDIYELPIELHRELILKRWKEFADNALEMDKVFVFECCFIQNPVTVTMIKNNLPMDASVHYVKSLENIIEPLKPLLIYSEQKDIKYSFRKAAAERSKGWFEFFKDYYTNQGYGLAKGLRGLDGVLEVLEARKRLEEDIYDSLKIAKYKLDNSEFCMDVLRDKVSSVLKAQIIENE
jgi:adenylate kinase family enzyme